MRALEIARFGLDGLSVVERQDAAPGPGQVRLSLRAASLNYRDLLMVEGKYNPRLTLPIVPGSDGVGIVEAVGQGVTRVAIGDRVSPVFSQTWLDGAPARDKLRGSLGGPLDGTLRTHMVLSADGVVRVPAYLSDAEAATLPCAAVTAWNALVGHAKVQPGDVVLVQGTGGVSLFALQIARMCGARVIVTSSSDEKLERARGLGAFAGINYQTTPEWGKAARALCPEGVDVVIEVGGAGTLEQSIKATRVGGQIAIIGVLGGNRAPSLDLRPVLMQEIRLQGVLVGSRATFEAMNRAFAEHEVHPVVDRVFPLTETRAALEHLRAGAHFGKIAIAIG